MASKASFSTSLLSNRTVTSCVSELKAGGRLSHDCKVEFVEINTRALDISGIGEVFPPGMSPVSGLILCYDAHRRETLHGLSEVIRTWSPVAFDHRC